MTVPLLLKSNNLGEFEYAFVTAATSALRMPLMSALKAPVTVSGAGVAPVATLGFTIVARGPGWLAAGFCTSVERGLSVGVARFVFEGVEVVLGLTVVEEFEFCAIAAEVNVATNAIASNSLLVIFKPPIAENHAETQRTQVAQSADQLSS